MRFIPLPLAGAYLIEPEPVSDSRGWFSRTFDKNQFVAIGFSGELVQCNNSYTTKSGSIRGLHFQRPPFTEIKLIRCVAGAVFDVIVDVRSGSPTFLNYYGAELSAENRMQIFIPDGFAHGFQTLTDGSELFYSHSSYYTPNAEGAIRYNDPAVGIEWPLEVSEISQKDSNHPFLSSTFSGINFF